MRQCDTNVSEDYTNVTTQNTIFLTFNNVKYDILFLRRPD
jgi:hypothetical protein